MHININKITNCTTYTFIIIYFCPVRGGTYDWFEYKFCYNQLHKRYNINTVFSNTCGLESSQFNVVVFMHHSQDTVPLSPIT